MRPHNPLQKIFIGMKRDFEIVIKFLLLEALQESSQQTATAVLGAPGEEGDAMILPKDEDSDEKKKKKKDILRGERESAKNIKAGKLRCLIEL